MNRVAAGALIAAAVVLLIVAMAATYTVHQAEQALVVQFGEPRRVIDEPGLHWKIPFVENVELFDKRVLDFDAPTQEIPTLDQKQVLVNAFAKFRIVNALMFFQTARDVDTMKDRLGAIISSNLRQALGRIPMQQILTAERATLMEEISTKVSEEAKGFGIEVLDVRMKRVDLPPENSQAVYRRMQTQREQEARRIRAEGDREKATIRAEADKQQVVIVAGARRQSEILRGEGDGQATAIYNAAYGRDSAFFDFFRSMQAMREGLPHDTTTFVGPTSGEFFRYFSDSDAASGLSGGAPATGEQTSSAPAQVPAAEPQAESQPAGEEGGTARQPEAESGPVVPEPAEPVEPSEPGSGAEAPAVTPEAEDSTAGVTPAPFEAQPSEAAAAGDLPKAPVTSAGGFACPDRGLA
jgi:membrane protease subunit HflC